MNTVRNLGVATGIASVLLSSTIVFAQGKPAGAGSGAVTQGAGNQYQPGENVYNENSTQGSSTPRTGPGAVNQGAANQYRPSRGRGFSATGSSTPGGVVGGQARGQAERAQGQARAAEMQAKVQQRLASIQDRVKQQLAEHLAGVFDHINQIWTDHFSKLLDRYAAILQKIQDRATAAAASGKDVTATDAAIKTAQASIASARTAVAAQAAKTYTLDLSSTTPVTAATSTAAGQGQIMQGLRASFQSLHDTLFKDLFALRDGPMTDTRKAVQSALQTLGQIPGVDQAHATSTEATSTNQ